jgi:hypothetical protein
MQLINLSLSQGNFYNPATGELIVDADEGLNIAALSLKGVWNNEVLESPDLFDEELAKAWNTQYEAFLAAEEDNPDDGYTYTDYVAMLEKFLTDFEHEDRAAFKVMSTQLSCGPSRDINWYVLDLG